MLPHTKRRRAAERISVKYVDIITQHHEDITLSGKQLQQLLSEKLALGARRRGAKYVWVWGWNEEFQLGLGDREDRLEPTCIQSLTNSGIVEMVAGCAHTIALTSHGQLYSWGSNVHGQLGLNMHVDKQQPVPKLIIPLLRETVVAVSSYNGCHHCLALTDKNKIYAWGANGQGQLGLSDNDFRNTPQLIPFIFDEKITGISAGGHEDYGFSVITCENMVFTFGYNANGQLALGTFDSVQESSPKKALIERVTKVGTGDFHAIFLTSDGSVLNVGSNEKGQLGQGHFDNSSVPVRVTFFDDKHVIDVIAGADVSLALTEALELYSWGGQHDRYQIATFTIGSTPSLLTHMSSSQPVRVVRGYQHGLALTKSGKIVVGGYNNLGQIGTGKRDDIVYNEARELDFFQDATIVFIGCGDNHSFCLTN